MSLLWRASFVVRGNGVEFGQTVREIQAEDKQRAVKLGRKILRKLFPSSVIRHTGHVTRDHIAERDAARRTSA